MTQIDKITVGSSADRPVFHGWTYAHVGIAGKTTQKRYVNLYNKIDPDTRVVTYPDAIWDTAGPLVRVGADDEQVITGS